MLYCTGRLTGTVIGKLFESFLAMLLSTLGPRRVISLIYRLIISRRPAKTMPLFKRHMRFAYRVENHLFPELPTVEIISL